MEARRIIGWNVRRLRVERRITIEELAGRADLASGTVGRIERGAINTSSDTMDRLAKALRVKLIELVVEPTKGAKPPEPLKAGRRRR